MSITNAFAARRAAETQARREHDAAVRFAAVQAAAQVRGSGNLNTSALARQIVSAADGDMRVAYDFLDTLNAHVTRMLQEKNDGQN